MICLITLGTRNLAPCLLSSCRSRPLQEPWEHSPIPDTEVLCALQVHIDRLCTLCLWSGGRERLIYGDS